MLKGIINGISSVFGLFYIMILIRCALSFVRGIDYRQQPWNAIKTVTDPYLDLFRRLIPPIGMIDISPIVALFALGLIQSAVIYFVLIIWNLFALG